MSADWLERTELLLGKEKLEKLKNSNVLVAGLGGVGAYAAESLCRAGVGKMTIIDSDVINISNINRQLLAHNSSVGKGKALLMAERLLAINPELDLTTHAIYIKDEISDEILNEKFDYVVDAIDTLAPKIFFIRRAVLNGLKIVSSMGAGGKTDPSKIMVSDFSDSYNCKLAKLLRKKLSSFGIKSGFKVVFSSELIDENSYIQAQNERNKKTTVGTISYLPAIFGLFCASVVIRELIDEKIELEKSPLKMARKRKHPCI
ncbi:MAG: tRNA threonylcarbamoyladenosine dehydratase [Bacteroidales bacterium]